MRQRSQARDETRWWRDRVIKTYIKRIGTLAKTFGLRGLSLRIVHEVRLRAGEFRDTPRHVPSREIHSALGLRATVSDFRSAANTEVGVSRANRVLSGEYEAFRSLWRPLPSGNGWSQHPATGLPRGAGEPWWRISHLDPTAGDIKDIWEPARFAWLYDLVRGYLLTGDLQYAASARERVQDWLEANPPFVGVHWSCGQETAIRAIAVLFSEANLPQGYPEARGRLSVFLAASGERIADAIGYAVSQRNNHAISEAAGLILLGARLQNQHPEAAKWQSKGRRLLERLIREQFEPDGWYIQHSFTYQRLALEQAVVGLIGLRGLGLDLSDEAKERLRASVRLLVSVMDLQSGDVPNHGSNDGAMVLPLSSRGYRDFRPVVTLASAVLKMAVPENLELDPEPLAWLGLGSPEKAAPRSDGAEEGPSGWATARLNGWQVFLRAGRYKSRPSQIDPLHLDVRWGCEAVVVDPGTYAYNGAPPWRNGLVSSGVHNGPILDDVEPGVRGPRFLWYEWPDARIVSSDFSSKSTCILAVRPREVERRVTVTSERIVVEDTILKVGARRYTANWLLAPGVPADALQVVGSRTGVAVEGDVHGWYSSHYGKRVPSSYVTVVREVSAGETVTTTIQRPSLA